MRSVNEQALIHVALLLLMVGCMAVARKPGMEAFYFFAGMLCVPVFGSLLELFNAASQRIKNS